ncbi:MAG TPA: hypothetical protein PK167_02320 [Prolixibacteraceae bacterium]|nr:hypothetical protein [Prolixibacteraceae bacterium]
MSKSAILPVAMVLFWAGFVCSISFMEAWLKFRAQGVTLPIGLSIGNKVFTAMNRTEWVFFILFVTAAWRHFGLKPAGTLVLALLLLAVLLIQSFVLLPQLSERVFRIIDGETVEKSTLHLQYVMAEVVKVGTLIYTGFHLAAKGG